MTRAPRLQPAVLRASLVVTAMLATAFGLARMAQTDARHCPLAKTGAARAFQCRGEP